jgi:hypothetical protein
MDSVLLGITVFNSNPMEFQPLKINHFFSVILGLLCMFEYSKGRIKGGLAGVVAPEPSRVPKWKGPKQF